MNTIQKYCKILLYMAILYNLLYTYACKVKVYKTVHSIIWHQHKHLHGIYVVYAGRLGSMGIEANALSYSASQKSLHHLHDMMTYHYARHWWVVISIKCDRKIIYKFALYLSSGSKALNPILNIIEIRSK